MSGRHIQACGLALVGALLAACTLLVAPSPTATPGQTLAVTMWVERPILQYGGEQVVHVVVADKQGNGVRSATVQGKLALPGGEAQLLVFPVTDADGYTTLAYSAPASGQTRQTFTVTVDAAFLSRYGAASMDYEVRP